MTFCKDCRHLDESWGSYCYHPTLQRLDPVDGPRPVSPYEQRKPSGKCGPWGRFFEERGTVTMWKRIKRLFREGSF